MILDQSKSNFSQNRLHSVKNRVGGIEGRGEKEDNRIILRSGCHEMHWLRWQPILLTTYIEEVVDKRNVVSIWPGLSLLDDWVISTAAEMGFSLSPSPIPTFFSGFELPAKWKYHRRSITYYVLHTGKSSQIKKIKEDPIVEFAFLF